MLKRLMTILLAGCLVLQTAGAVYAEEGITASYEGQPPEETETSAIDSEIIAAGPEEESKETDRAFLQAETEEETEEKEAVSEDPVTLEGNPEMENEGSAAEEKDPLSEETTPRPPSAENIQADSEEPPDETEDDADVPAAGNTEPEAPDAKEDESDLLTTEETESENKAEEKTEIKKASASAGETAATLENQSLIPAQPVIAMFGDSFTKGTGGSGYTVPISITENLGVVCDNFGIASIGWLRTIAARDYQTAYTSIVNTDLSPYNVVILCYGINDSVLGDDMLGEWDSTDENTVVGMMRKALDALIEKKPDARIIILAPYIRYDSDRAVMRAVFAQVAADYGLTYIDQDDCPFNSETMYELSSDGTGGHPSKEGYQKIGEWLSEKLRVILDIHKAEQELAAKDLVVTCGKTTEISVTGAQGKVRYSSPDTQMATVNSKGTVRGRTVGTTEISVTAAETSLYNAAETTVRLKTLPAATGSFKTAIRASGIKLGWKKVAGATGYYIYRNGEKVKTISSGDTTGWLDKNANVNGRKYTYEIIAFAKGVGTSKESRKVTACFLSKKALSVTSKKTEKAAVVWQKNAKADGYEIQYSTSKTFAADNQRKTVKDVTILTKTVSGLTSGKKYYFRMRSFKTVDGTKYYSSWSMEKAVTVK